MAVTEKHAQAIRIPTLWELSPPFWFIGDEAFLVKMVYLEVSWGADMALDSAPGHPRITQLVSGSLRRIWFLVCLAKGPCMERPPEGAPEGLR